MKFRLKVDISSTETKKGIKIQFVLPQTNIDISQKEEITQKLQTKLGSSLKRYGLNLNVDTDIQFSNVIGFLILLPDIKTMIKKALKEGDNIINNGEKT